MPATIRPACRLAMQCDPPAASLLLSAPEKSLPGAKGHARRPPKKGETECLRVGSVAGGLLQDRVCV